MSNDPNKTEVDWTKLDDVVNKTFFMHFANLNNTRFSVKFIKAKDQKEAELIANRYVKYLNEIDSIRRNIPLQKFKIISIEEINELNYLTEDNVCRYAINDPIVDDPQFKK